MRLDEEVALALLGFRSALPLGKGLFFPFALELVVKIFLVVAAPLVLPACALCSGATTVFLQAGLLGRVGAPIVRFACLLLLILPVCLISTVLLLAVPGTVGTNGCRAEKGEAESQPLSECGHQHSRRKSRTIHLT